MIERRAAQPRMKKTNAFKRAQPHRIPPAHCDAADECGGPMPRLGTARQGGQRRSSAKWPGCIIDSDNEAKAITRHDPGLGGWFGVGPGQRTTGAANRSDPATGLRFYAHRNDTFDWFINIIDEQQQQIQSRGTLASGRRWARYPRRPASPAARSRQPITGKPAWDAVCAGQPRGIEPAGDAILESADIVHRAIFRSSFAKPRGFTWSTSTGARCRSHYVQSQRRESEPADGRLAQAVLEHRRLNGPAAAAYVNVGM